MVRRNQVRVGGNLQPRGIRTASFQAINLLKQRFQVDDDAIAQNRGGIFRQNTRREQFELVFLTANDNGVAGVVSSVGLDDVIHLAAQNVCGFPFAFVAPLGADDDDRCHTYLITSLRSVV